MRSNMMKKVSRAVLALLCAMCIGLHGVALGETLVELIPVASEAQEVVSEGFEVIAPLAPTDPQAVTPAADQPAETLIPLPSEGGEPAPMDGLLPLLGESTPGDHAGNLFTVSFVDPNGYPYYELLLMAGSPLERPLFMPGMEGLIFSHWFEVVPPELDAFGNVIEPEIPIHLIPYNFPGIVTGDMVIMSYFVPEMTGEIQEDIKAKSEELILFVLGYDQKDDFMDTLQERQMDIAIYSSQQAVIRVGEAITLSAELQGFEGLEVRLQWQYSTFGVPWTDVPGANSDTYAFYASLENLQYTWRLAVTVLGPAAE